MTPTIIYRTLAESLELTVAQLRLGWRGLSRPTRLSTVVMLVMLVGGVVFRVQGIAAPHHLTFDEQFYAPTAHHYLVGVPDLHDHHPPLGKLLGMIGLLLFGYGPVGWRFMYLCIGLLNILMGFLLARELFKSSRTGLFAAALIAADGFFLSYSRAALIDPILTCLILWSMLAAVMARTWRGMLLTAILFGLATSVKWSGAMAAIPIAVTWLTLQRFHFTRLLWFGVTPVVHLLVWFVGLWVMGHATDPESIYRVLKTAFVSLEATGRYSNPLASAWWSWPLLWHPIVIKLSHSGITSTYASSAGNVVFFYPVTLLVVTIPLFFAGSWLRRSWRATYNRLLDREFSHRALLLVLGWAAMISMWSIVLGKHMFFYHYMPSYGFGIILLSGVVARLERRFPWVVYGFLLLGLSVAIFYLPVWAEFPIGERYANLRLFPMPWRP